MRFLILSKSLPGAELDAVVSSLMLKGHVVRWPAVDWNASDMWEAIRNDVDAVVSVGPPSAYEAFMLGMAFAQGKRLALLDLPGRPCTPTWGHRHYELQVWLKRLPVIEKVDQLELF
jgi:hypothetical protein